MASFMTKKKKYKFHVEICLEELLEVPFVSAVLFAKMRLLDGGSFQDHSSRQEVRDHKVLWGNSFSFPCKMMANATTGVMERCVLRISIRKESKGGRSFNKLGFVDLNLAEFAGAGLVHKKALLEGYDARHRQDNSMLKFKIELSMTSGDVLFKAPSPSLTHKQVKVEDSSNDPRSDEVSSGSLAGSIASGSSGFGSLPKKRPALLSSDLVIGQTLTETNVPVSIAPDLLDPPTTFQQPPTVDSETARDLAGNQTGEHGHSRNSSNTSQLSKASGYSSVHSRSHSRQSSSGDSGHIREQPPSRTNRKRHLTNPHPSSNQRKPNIPETIPSSDTELSFSTIPITSTPLKQAPQLDRDISVYSTPKNFQKQMSLISDSSNDEYRTPEGSFLEENKPFNFKELQKSRSISVVVEKNRPPNRLSSKEMEKNQRNSVEGVLRSQSDFQIPRTPLFTVEPTSIDKVFSSNVEKNRLANRISSEEAEKNKINSVEGVLRSQSDFQIPRTPLLPVERTSIDKLFGSNVEKNRSANRIRSEEAEKNKIKSVEGVLRSQSDFQIPRTPLLPVERTSIDKLFSSNVEKNRSANRIRSEEAEKNKIKSVEGVLRSQSDFQIPRTPLLPIERTSVDKLFSSNVEKNRLANRLSAEEVEKYKLESEGGVLRSKSDFQIPLTPSLPVERTFTDKLFSSDSLFSFLTPRLKRRTISSLKVASHPFKVPASSLPDPKKLPEARATSLSSLRSGRAESDWQSAPR
ncbi:unnamed protein product [Phaedon cochleariae]|uniref:C2 NT-type domain-containing protein n=1 Tax=Phaedon cochleariae TaxID=80249 RepID=A0A9P0DHW1_PHACE|nr:unnamed protein product [Phaedon cochleariae]